MPFTTTTYTNLGYNTYVTPIYQGAYTQSTTTASTQIWNCWITTSTVTNNNYQTWTGWNQNDWRPMDITVQATVNTEEMNRVMAEIQATEDRRAELICQQRETRALAEVKANRLLELVLSDEQRAELKTHRRFHVRGSRGRRYRIHANGQSGNVSWVDDAGKELGRFCAHPAGYLPDADAWLAQSLAIQTDEDAFLAVANLHAGTRPPQRRDDLVTLAA